jgi:hypothetical protein
MPTMMALNWHRTIWHARDYEIIETLEPRSFYAIRRDCCDLDLGKHETLELAIAACQADHEKRESERAERDAKIAAYVAKQRSQPISG